MSKTLEFINRFVYGELQKLQIADNRYFNIAFEALEARQAEWIGQYISAGNLKPAEAILEDALVEDGLTRENVRVRFSDEAMQTFRQHAFLSLRTGMEEKSLFSDALLARVFNIAILHLDEWVNVGFTDTEFVQWALDFEE